MTPGDLPIYHIIYEFDHKVGVGLELPYRALFELVESSPLDRVVRTIRGHIVGDDVVVSYLVPLLRVIPEPAHIPDIFPRIIDQGVQPCDLL